MVTSHRLLSVSADLTISVSGRCPFFQTRPFQYGVFSIFFLDIQNDLLPSSLSFKHELLLFPLLAQYFIITKQVYLLKGFITFGQALIQHMVCPERDSSD